MKFKTSDERAAYYKGKYEALKEKAGNTGSMIKQSVIDHTVRYVLITLFVVGGSFGTYYYVSNKVTETVTEIKQDVKDSIPHPIDSTKKWFKEDHWWNKDNNKTVIVVEPAETVEVIKEEKEVIQDKNETGFFVNARKKMFGLKFWRKKNENNESKEK